MSTYAEKHAEVYDLLYADKPYAHEASFVAALMRAHSVPNREIRRILDVACGTANHALAFAALGFEVFGVDASEAMLRIARRKIAGNERIQVKHQDMQSLKTGLQHERPFDGAVCLFDSIGHAVEDEAVASALNSMSELLVPGGVAVIEFWHAPALVQGFQPYRVRRVSTPDAEILRISETELDLTRQVARVHYRFVELKKNGRWESTREEVRVKFFGVAEMAAVLKRAGLTALAFHDGYSSSTCIMTTSIHVVVLARRD